MPARLAASVASSSSCAALVLARGIADLAGAAADQRDRPLPGPLQPAQQHDADQVADVQAVGGAVEADVGGEPAVGGERVDRLEVGRLVDEAARGQLAHEIRARAGSSAGLRERGLGLRAQRRVQIALDHRAELL